MFKGASKQSRQLSDLGKPSLGRLTVSLFDGKGLVKGNPITCSHIVSGKKSPRQRRGKVLVPLRKA